MLIGFKLVAVAGDQDVDVQLALDQRQSQWISPWNDLMSVTQSDPELTHGHHFLFRVRDVVVKVSSDDMDVTGQCFQVIKCLLRAEISRAQDMLDPTRNQQFLELGRQTVASVRNVNVSNHKDKLME